ncbi:MAG: hypothetical protein ABI285_00950 [Ginsengibacter sp.]
MLKTFLINLILIAGIGAAIAQTDKSVNEKSQNENLTRLAATVFKYQNFMPGEIILKDSSIAPAKLNYNRILGQFLYITRQGKTAPVDSETIDKLIIGIDTFQMSNNIVLEKITHFPGTNIYTHQLIRYIKNEKTTDNNGPIIITDGSRLPFSIEPQTGREEVMDKSAQFKFINEYFLLDKSMKTYNTSKKSFYDLFPQLKTELKNYLQDHSVNFNNLSDLKNLLQYLNGR